MRVYVLSGDGSYVYIASSGVSHMIKGTSKNDKMHV